MYIMFLGIKRDGFKNHLGNKITSGIQTVGRHIPTDNMAHMMKSKKPEEEIRSEIEKRHVRHN